MTVIRVIAGVTSRSDSNRQTDGSTLVVIVGETDGI